MLQQAEPGQQQQQLDNMDLPALFWDTLPADAEQHPDYAALQALAEEDPPEVRAENFKVGMLGDGWTGRAQKQSRTCCGHYLGGVYASSL